MVWLKREDLEDRELRTLSRWAAFSRHSLGRRIDEPEDPLRTAFQRDRDRILHSRAFRRLQHKTQVLAAYQGDHYRSRLSHSLEVSQMARSTATALRLNADLAEAVALAHDLGHPPFGHAGERTLDRLMQGHGGFRHNAQGARIVDSLEERSGRGYGLNLTMLTRRSLLKGRIPEGFPLSPDLLPVAPPPLEAHLVDHCDRIAYLCHDLDDGLRAGLFDEAEAGELEIWKVARAHSGESSRHRVISEITALLIHDLVRTCDEALSGPGDEPGRLGPSKAMRAQAGELFAFLQQRFYGSAKVLDVMNRGCEAIERLFERFVRNPDLIPHAQTLARGDVWRAACDYIAGMTDRFLLKQ